MGPGENPVVSGAVLPPGCGLFSVSGLRVGTTLVMTATKATNDNCAAWTEISAVFNNCNTASGRFVNSNFQSSTWSWMRSTTQQSLVSYSQRPAPQWTGGN